MRCQRATVFFVVRRNLIFAIRRLVVEYLQKKLGDITIMHLQRDIPFNDSRPERIPRHFFDKYATNSQKFSILHRKNSTPLINKEM